MNVNDALIEQIDDLNRQKAIIEAQIAHQNDRPEDENLAIWLHDKLCLGNHAEGCEFQYEKGFDKTEHKKYLAKARAILEVTDAGTAIRTITIATKR